MKTFVIALLFSLAVTSPAIAEQACSVHDGDTLTLCSGQKVRIWGIDAPELHQPMGYISASYLRNMVMGKELELKCRGKSYKRSVCSVAIDSPGGRLDAGREMVIHGMAYDYPKYSHATYQEADGLAKSQRVGVWKQPDGGERPWDFRHKDH